jgi:AAA ATPase domain
VSDSGPSNPYDFRSPVRNLHLLAGRTEELERIDNLMRAAAGGRPTHLSIFGAVGCGKSSLLTAAAEIARARDLLPIQITLRSAIVASELSFYREIVDTGLQALVAIGYLDSHGDAMSQWLQQTRLGESVLRPGVPVLEVGLLAAAALSGKVVTDVPLAGLQRDFAVLLNVGNGSSFRGIAVCLDDAEYVDNNTEVAQSISALAATYPTLAVVTASATTGKLHAVAPRAWIKLKSSL